MQRLCGDLRLETWDLGTRGEGRGEIRRGARGRMGRGRGDAGDLTLNREPLNQTLHQDLRYILRVFLEGVLLERAFVL